MPLSGAISASSGDSLPENVSDLLKAFEAGETAGAKAVEEAPSPENPPIAPTTEPAPPKADEPEWYKVLEGLTEDELLAHPKLSGRFGKAVQKNVDKKLADVTAQQARVQKQLADDALLEQNPQAYRQQRIQERAQTNQLATLYEQVYKPLKDDFSELPEPVQSELAQKSYEHLSPADSAVAYTRDRNAAMVKYEVARMLDKAVKEAREAERKKVLAELNGGSPRPDTGASAGSPRKSFTPSTAERMGIGDYKALGKTPAERVAAVLNGHSRSA